MFLDELGTRLRQRRESRRLTQLDVASALQVSPQAVSKWERGENAPDIMLLGALAALLGTTTDWILGRQQPAGDEFEATVFVSSVQGFTARCESLRPAEIALWTNGFLHQVTEAATREGGIPVKYLGDSLLAFFAGDGHVARAAAAAVSARNAVADRLVVALVSGPVHLTSIGHAAHARSDIIGSTVNKAFRVLGWAATNSATRVVAAVLAPDDALGAFEVTDPQPVDLKGIAGGVDLVEIVGRGAPPAG